MTLYEKATGMSRWLLGFVILRELLSDKQEAFVRGIAAEFPGMPHRYGANHF